MSPSSFDSDDKQNLDNKSKTQLKKEMMALQELGQSLTRLTNKQLGKLQLPLPLRAAIDEYKRLPNSHGAKKRQIQFIGRVMRDFDAESIKLAMTKLIEGTSKPAPNNFFELICSKLLEHSDQYINELLTQHPNLERQKLHQLQREYRKAKAEKQQHCREKIMRYLREEIGDQLNQ